MPHIDAVQLLEYQEVVAMADHDTLCGWGDRAKVAWFVANAETVIPRRREQLRLLAELIPSPCDAEIAVLDLGAGFGAATEEILTRYVMRPSPVSTVPSRW
jgi:hypothetical protein